MVFNKLSRTLLNLKTFWRLSSVWENSMYHKTLIVVYLLCASFETKAVAEQSSAFDTRTSPVAERSVVLRPLFSLLLPGFDQYLAGQYEYGLAYSAVGLAAQAWHSDRKAAVLELERSEDYRRLSKKEKENLWVHGETYRQRNLASQFILASGGFSAYHSFRTSVRSHQESGAYAFLTEEESPIDLLKAPFRFSYLKKPSTIVPLALISALAIFNSSAIDFGYERIPLSRADMFYTGAVSYNAGTFEEAAFRGWMMPVIMEKTQSEFWSNNLQALLFAAAHANQIAVPYVQFGLGFYLGWLTQQNNWAIGQSIFIHAWWDVAALLLQYQRQKVDPQAILPVIWLPALRLAF